MSVSAANRFVAKHALKAFGGVPNVQAYHDDAHRLSVDLLRCADRPSGGVTSYSTIGLSDCAMLKEDGTEFATRLEIAGACASADASFANVLASAALCIMRTRKLCSPGTVLPGYVHEYFRGTSVPHLYFTAPYLWDDALTTLECETKRVSWLLAVPISNGEQEYLQAKGDSALEDLFEEHQIDIFDLGRASAA